MILSDEEMFPQICSTEELSPKLKLWSLVRRFHDGVYPQELTEEALNLGICSGDPLTVAQRVGELLDEMANARAFRRMEHLGRGRFRAVLAA